MIFKLVLLKQGSVSSVCQSKGVRTNHAKIASHHRAIVEDLASNVAECNVWFAARASISR